MKRLALFTSVLALWTGSAMAANEALKDILEKSLHVQIESIEKTPYDNLYEVLTPEIIFYTDEKGTFVITGSLLDTATGENQTDKSLKKMAQQEFKKLPFEKAIKTVYGKGERQIVTFEDPNCGYCKRLYKELSTIDNLTVYTFMVPILGPDSVKKTHHIWCAENREEAWKAWMTQGKTPAAVQCDTDPSKEIIQYTRKIGLRGTPVILFENGERLNGYAEAKVIEETLH